MKKVISYDHLKEHIQRHQLKATHQRLVIYKALLEDQSHPDAENVYNKVRPLIPSVSKGTVYKTLETFVEVGLAKQVMTKSGMMRFDAKMEDHNHIYLTDTDEIIDFEDAQLSSLILEYLKKKKISNLDIHRISVQISGVKEKANKHISIE